MEDTMKELELLIPQYAENKQEADSYKKICEEENARIKQLMTKLDITEKVVSGYKVTKSVTSKVSLNEDRVLTLLQRELGMENPFVGVKYYLDVEKLETALYRGDIPTELVAKISDCKEVKPDVVQIRLTKLRKKGVKEDV